MIFLLSPHSQNPGWWDGAQRGPRSLPDQSPRPSQACPGNLPLHQPGRWSRKQLLTPPPTFPTAHWASSARRGYSVRGAKQPGILQAVLTWASVLERGGRAPCAPRPLRLIAQRAHNPLRLAEEWGLLRSACADHKRAVGDDLTRCHCPKRRGAA